jgi:hypothetical protein
MAWFVVRHYADKYQPSESNKFYVEQGDIIKFGRVRFKIRKLRIREKDEDNYSHDSLDMGNVKDDITVDD